jgi:hypothetical protein
MTKTNILKIIFFLSLPIFLYCLNGNLILLYLNPSYAGKDSPQTKIIHITTECQDVYDENGKITHQMRVNESRFLEICNSSF